MSRASSSLSSSTSDRAHRHAERLEERVGHRAADDQPVDPRQHALDDLDLVRHLGAADDGDERPLGIAQRHAEIGELLLHQQAGAGRPQSAAPCPPPRRARGAPRRTHRSRRRRRARPARPRTPGRSSLPRRGSAGSRAAPASTRPARAPPPLLRFAAAPMQSLAKVTGRPTSAGQVIGHRLQAELGRGLALGPPEVRGEDDRARPRRARSGWSAAPR